MKRAKYQTPKNERVWTWYFDSSDHLRFIMTTKVSNRDFYFLYQYENDGFKKLGKAKNPVDLEEKFHVNDIVKGGAK